MAMARVFFFVDDCVMGTTRSHEHDKGYKEKEKEKESPKELVPPTAPAVLAEMLLLALWDDTKILFTQLPRELSAQIIFYIKSKDGMSLKFRLLTKFLI